jgi:glycosyltransferase involved in cell wall biosynthesis
VEEALSHGLPVIVSTHVGCHPELVKEGETGVTFDPRNESSLIDAIRRMGNPRQYRMMREKVIAIDFRRRAEEQITAYVLANEK